MTTVALRTALIWNDEVMDDVVLKNPKRITIGASGRPTFVVPELGLPPEFAIVQPGNRGFLLTLSERMRGTICIDGQQQDVRDLMKRAGDSGQGGFWATPISGRDWGVIDLDETGVHKLFFQFVPVEDERPFLTKNVMMAGAIGWAVSCVGLAAMWAIKGVDVGEAIARGAALATAAIALGGLMRWIINQDGESQASIVFSALAHAALLFMVYSLYDGSNAFAWPGTRSLTGNYLVTRLEPQQQVIEPKVATSASTIATTTTIAPNPTAITTVSPGTRPGGGRPHPAGLPTESPTPAGPAVGMLDPHNRTQLDRMLGRGLDLGQFSGLGPSHGDGTGKHNGKGQGECFPGQLCTKTGGPGPKGPVTSHGPVTLVPQRKAPECKGAHCAGGPIGPIPVVKIDGPSDTDGVLTKGEIAKVVNAGRGLIRVCYTRELQRNESLAGKLIVHFQIDGEGVVTSARIGAGSTLHSDAVESCVQRNIRLLRFPARGSLSNVKFPFGFSPG